jgi:hypothetical protein
METTKKSLFSHANRQLYAQQNNMSYSKPKLMMNPMFMQATDTSLENNINNMNQLTVWLKDPLVT